MGFFPPSVFVCMWSSPSHPFPPPLPSPFSFLLLLFFGILDCAPHSQDIIDLNFDDASVLAMLCVLRARVLSDAYKMVAFG